MQRKKALRRALEKLGVTLAAHGAGGGAGAGGGKPAGAGAADGSAGSEAAGGSAADDDDEYADGEEGEL